MTLEERSVFLDRLTGEDRRVRGEVVSLLCAYDLATDFLERPAVAGERRPAREAERRSRVGERLGPYVILERLGQGGMGTVYLAARADEQYERLVAVKVLAPGADDDASSRILRERQILAELDHPYIGRLYDGGETADGAPYLVMELIDGAPIDLYCDESALTVEERLALFLKVCAAVHYAHQSLVIHRDIKPMNILVNAGGEPKLLDFGIAKIVGDAASSAARDATRTGHRPMTPRYASPEQICGEALTTATDVYSLGVVLYELLTGRRPDAPSEGSRPAAPSDAAGLPAPEQHGGAPSARELARRRGLAHPRQLQRRLAGDLDRIVLQALHEEPAARYPSVERFADDIRRHLRGLPVAARGDSFFYAAGKLVRRNKVASTLAAGLILLTLASAGALAVLRARAAGERDQAVAERDRAELLYSFLIDVFEESDPQRTPPSARTLSDLLERSRQRAVAELTDQPEVQARILYTIGQIYHHQGLYEPALPALEQALELRAKVLGPKHPEVARTLTALATLKGDRSEVVEALELQQQAVAIEREVLGGDAPQLANSLDNLAGLYRLRAEPERAERLYREALGIRLRSLGERDAAVAGTLNDLAVLRQEAGDLPAAEQLHRQALEIMRESLGPRHPKVGVVMNNLGLILEEKGELDAAESLLREALEILRETVGDEHQNVAGSLNKLAGVALKRGDLAAAEQLTRESLEMRERLLGGDHPAVAVSLNSLASLLRQRGDLEAAERHYRRALSIARAHMPPGFHGIAHILVGLGQVLVDGGRPAEAEPLLREAVQIRRQALVAGSPLIGEAESALERCRAARGQASELGGE